MTLRESIEALAAQYEGRLYVYLRADEVIRDLRALASTGTPAPWCGTCGTIQDDGTGCPVSEVKVPGGFACNRWTPERTWPSPSTGTPATAGGRFCEYEDCDQPPLADGFCDKGPGHDGRHAHCGAKDPASPRRCVLAPGHDGPHLDSDVREAVFADPHMCPAPQPSPVAPAPSTGTATGVRMNPATLATLERTVERSTGIDVETLRATPLEDIPGLRARENTGAPDAAEGIAAEIEARVRAAAAPIFAKARAESYAKGRRDERDAILAAFPCELGSYVCDDGRIAPCESCAAARRIRALAAPSPGIGDQDKETKP